MNIRQGDVLIIPAPQSMGAGAKDVVKREDGRIVLAYGEATGHAHVVLERDAEMFSTADAVDRFLRTGADGATALHDEHRAIPFDTAPHGHIVRRQQEYTPGAIRNIAD